MKIGIITLPLHFNYGGILQAYALEEILRRMGHEVEHLELKRKKKLLPLKTRYLIYGKRFFEKYMLRRNVRVFQETYLYNSYNVVNQYTKAFISRYIKIREIDSFDEIKSSDYNALVVGSDQIWRNNYVGKTGGYAPFFDFAQNWDVIKVAYACSFANDKWLFTEEETSILIPLAHKFNSISTRERSGVALCKEHLKVENVSQVLDPTMLLDRQDYEKIIENGDTHPCSGNLLCYVLDETPEKNRLISECENMTGMKMFRANGKAENRWASAEDRIQPPVEQWLRGFRDAELVITDSFHACVFSIIFNKPFICLGNDTRGNDRFISLLSQFDLQDRLILDYSNLDDIKRVLVSPNIDMTSLKETSLQFINSAL